MTEITINRLENVNSGIAVNTHTCASKNGVIVFDWNQRDDKVLVVAENTGTSSVKLTFAEGNGIAGKNKEENLTWSGDAVTAVGTDCDVCEITVPASSTVAIALESSRFKWVSGKLKGKVLAVASAALKICAISEP